MKRNTILTAVAILAAALGTASSAHAQAINGFSCVGSAASVDESSMESFQADGPTLTIKQGGPRLKRLVVRYAIPPLEALSQPQVAGMAEIAARVKDAGEGSFVKLALVEVDLQTGESRTKLTLDSDAAAASAAAQEIASSECDQQIAGAAFDFERNAYYIRAVLGQHNGGQAPELHNVQVRWQTSCQ